MYNEIGTIVFLGTELKLRIDVSPVDNRHFAKYKYNIELYTNTKKVEYDNNSDKVIGVDDSEDSVIVLLNTEDVGPGKLKCKVTAYIPDADFKDDGARTEIVVIDTGINIIKK